ncbi:hypothetical protein E5288_WYG006699 [Bos mutus]|uniref:Uncharacterized protein n=1 Tax=Bos mutus TaxID=72004 RepID=A0A6B0RE41_9CETA|nr:hypothetical protein [Bos mutus]
MVNVITMTFPMRSPKKMHAMEKKISGKLYKWEEAHNFKCSDNRKGCTTKAKATIGIPGDREYQEEVTGSGKGLENTVCPIAAAHSQSTCDAFTYDDFSNLL